MLIIFVEFKHILLKAIKNDYIKLNSTITLRIKKETYKIILNIYKKNNLIKKKKT